MPGRSSVFNLLMAAGGFWPPRSLVKFTVVFSDDLLIITCCGVETPRVYRLAIVPGPRSASLHQLVIFFVGPPLSKHHARTSSHGTHCKHWRAGDIFNLNPRDTELTPATTAASFSGMLLRSLTQFGGMVYFTDCGVWDQE